MLDITVIARLVDLIQQMVSQEIDVLLAVTVVSIIIMIVAHLVAWYKLRHTNISLSFKHTVQNKQNTHTHEK